MTSPSIIEIPQPETAEAAVRKFPSVEDMVFAYHEDWEYLRNLTLPVRPPTADEAAVYAARHEDPSWKDLVAPAEPRIVAPPSAEVTALMKAPVHSEPVPPAPVLDEHTEAAMTRFLSIHDANPAPEHEDPEPDDEPETTAAANT